MALLLLALVENHKVAVATQRMLMEMVFQTPLTLSHTQPKARHHKVLVVVLALKLVQELARVLVQVLVQVLVRELVQVIKTKLLLIKPYGFHTCDRLSKHLMMPRCVTKLRNFLILLRSRTGMKQPLWKPLKVQLGGKQSIQLSVTFS